MTMPDQKPGRSKQDYSTPAEFLDSVEARFGDIVCDLAAHENNAKHAVYYDEKSDSLSIPWAHMNPSGNLWLNPPFADIEPWAAKCLAESRKRMGFILMLTPASVGANWFALHIAHKAYVLALSPRMTFIGAPDPYPKDLMLTVFGYGLVGFDTWRWKK